MVGSRVRLSPNTYYRHINGREGVVREIREGEKILYPYYIDIGGVDQGPFMRSEFEVIS